MTDEPADWGDENSALFTALGDVITPSRQEHLDILVAILPADPDEAFTVVDLACGAGSLSEAILQHFSHCHVLALDGSPTMLAHARRRLAPFGGRVSFGSFDLHARAWHDRLPDDVRCFASSLAIHHLDGGEKRALFCDLAKRLPQGGGLLIFDLVDPASERVGRAYGDAWDAVVHEQSLQQTGSLDAYVRFRDGWNHYRDPDLEFDKPSGLFEQLCWLSDAGFRQVDCFWLIPTMPLPWCRYRTMLIEIENIVQNVYDACVAPRFRERRSKG